MHNLHKKIISELKKTLHSQGRIKTEGLEQSGSLEGKQYKLGNDTYQVFFNSDNKRWQVCKRPSLAPEKQFGGDEQGKADPDEVWQAFVSTKEN